MILDFQSELSTSSFVLIRDEYFIIDTSNSLGQSSSPLEIVLHLGDALGSDILLV